MTPLTELSLHHGHSHANGSKGPLFQCLKCGDCCVGYGGVYLDQMGLQKAAALLSITPYELTSLYLEPIGNRWSVKTGRDGRCLFYHEGCLIHRAKPLMCRAWPFFKRPLSSQEGFLEASEHCAALKNLDYESFLAAYEAIGRPLPPA